MSERIRHRYEKTSLCTPDHLVTGCQDSTGTIGMMALFVFLLRCLGCEFVAAGGEVIIHVAPHS
jgi:hypothetical protein